MSADNGVYILVSRGRKTRYGYKKEYRVVEAQAIENIGWAPNYPADADEQLLNREEVLSYFGNARVFNDRKIAEGYAQHMEDLWAQAGGSTEYGIVWFDEYAHIPFPKVQEQQQRRRPAPRSGLSVVV